MKHNNILKKLSLVGVAAITLLLMAPVSSPAAEPTATLHVIVNVVNNDGGTAVPADFNMHIRYLMKEVTGSPFPGASGTGTTFTLAPGSYLVTEDDVPISDGYVTYYGKYTSADITQNEGFVTLAAGDVVTLTRTENDWPIAGALVAQPTAAPVPPSTSTPPPKPVVTPTQSGGQLPATSSPWYNMLAISLGLVLVGSIGFRTRKAVK